MLEKRPTKMFQEKKKINSMNDVNIIVWVSPYCLTDTLLILFVL